jgi:hypothetical protein
MALVFKGARGTLVCAFKQLAMVQKRKYFKHSNNKKIKKQQKPEQFQQMTNGKNEMKETWELWNMVEMKCKKLGWLKPCFFTCHTKY